MSLLLNHMFHAIELMSISSDKRINLLLTEVNHSVSYVSCTVVPLVVLPHYLSWLGNANSCFSTPFSKFFWYYHSPSSLDLF